MSFLEVPLRLKLNVTVVALIKLCQASNTLEIYVEAISVLEMVSPIDLRLNSAGGWGGRGGEPPIIKHFQVGNGQVALTAPGRGAPL